MFLNLTLTPKIAPTGQKNNPEGPNKCKKAQNLAESKIKRQDCTSETKIDSLHQQVPKIFFNWTLTPRVAQTGQKNKPGGPKKCKKAQNLAELKTKRQGCTSKTKIDHLHQQVPKVFLNLTSTPNIAPQGKKITQKGP